MAEQWSCSRPGRIASLDRVPPPISSAASRTVTCTPARARTMAAARPLGPPPTTVAVVISFRLPGALPGHSPGQRFRRHHSPYPLIMCPGDVERDGAVRQPWVLPDRVGDLPRAAL